MVAPLERSERAKPPQVASFFRLLKLLPKLLLPGRRRGRVALGPRAALAVVAVPVIFISAVVVSDWLIGRLFSASTDSSRKQLNSPPSTAFALRDASYPRTRCATS